MTKLALATALMTAAWAAGEKPMTDNTEATPEFVFADSSTFTGVSWDNTPTSFHIMGEGKTLLILRPDGSIETEGIDTAAAAGKAFVDAVAVYFRASIDERDALRRQVSDLERALEQRDLP